MAAPPQKQTAEVALGRTRWCGGALALIGAVLLTGAASAQASKFRRLTPSVVAFASDGTRYVAWETHLGAPIAVFDTRTGHQAMHALPRGCRLARENEYGRNEG